mmetsp:Transcript_30266/g.57186  ORF Transcript_30266/g.57186 Transcript_30266/m.57186 type:complete len:314 (-) Transcript_30266:516-1457(-)
MPSTRRSMAPSSPLKALKPLSANSANIPPPALTPGKKFTALKAELEKKDAENEALRNSIAELTDALSGALSDLIVVKDKIDADVGNVGTSTATATAGAAAVAVATLSSSSSAAGVEAPPKKKKDKDAPIPSKTAYKFYCDARPKSKGGANNNMQQAWKASPPEIRQSYDAMAKADKARYARELATHEEEKAALEMYYGKKRRDMAMEFFDAHLTAALERVDAEKRKGKKKKVKKAKDPNAPKQASNKYIIFANMNRESIKAGMPEGTNQDLMTEVGRQWRESTEEEKAKYVEMAWNDKERYAKEMKKYTAEKK